MVYCRECAFSTEQRAPLFYSPALLHLHWIRELLPFTTSTEKTSLTALNSLHFFLLFKPTHKKKKKKCIANQCRGGRERNLTILDIRNSFRISLVRKLTSQPVTTLVCSLPFSPDGGAGPGTGSLPHRGASHGPPAVAGSRARAQPRVPPGARATSLFIIHPSGAASPRSRQESSSRGERSCPCPAATPGRRPGYPRGGPGGQRSPSAGLAWGASNLIFQKHLQAKEPESGGFRFRYLISPDPDI